MIIKAGWFKVAITCIYLCKGAWLFSWTRQDWIPFTRGSFGLTGQVALEKKILNDFNVSLLYLPLEKDVALHLNKPEFHSPNDALFQVWLKLAKCFWRSSLLKCTWVFLLVRLYLPREKGGTFHLNNLEFFSCRNALCQVWRIRILNVMHQCNLFFFFCNFTIISPTEKGRVFP